jgi:tetratricopeptide (TPR) repeat protein
VRFISILILLAVQSAATVSVARTPDEYINEARKHEVSGDLENAATTMKNAYQEHPEDQEVLAHLGMYLGMMAGQTQNYVEAGRLIAEAYDYLDRAVAMDTTHAPTRFQRGAISVHVPAFMGRLKQGIADLEYATNFAEDNPGVFPVEITASAYSHLGRGYEADGRAEEARAVWEKAIELAPGTAVAREAERGITGLRPPQTTIEETQPEPASSGEVQSLEAKIDREPDNAEAHIELGEAYISVGNYREAERVLRAALEIDDTNVEAYILLAEALGEMAGRGYDENIYEDTDLRTNLAFEVVNVLNKAVQLVPDNPELRLARGTVNVQMPFFTGTLDKGIEDLQMVAESDASNETVAEALFWLGWAYKKRGNTYWLDVITEHPGSSAADMAFYSMRPAVTHFDPSEYETPFVEIDFVLGFQDELAPQTAVWIEDSGGGFVRTLYVSAFSGYVKERQPNLAEWSQASGYADADAVTGASIDVGHHVIVWDLTDVSGKRVNPGEYTVNVEAMYWPSMQYQASSAAVDISGVENGSVSQTGVIIPYLEVKYHPE